jgi:hypothetical protein
LQFTPKKAMMKKVYLAIASIGAVIASSAVGGTNGSFLAPVSAPTLDEVGLGLLVVALAVIGGFLARRKK